MVKEIFDWVLNERDWIFLVVVISYVLIRFRPKKRKQIEKTQLTQEPLPKKVVASFSIFKS